VLNNLLRSSMNRLFRQHETRTCVSLDGLWNFALTPAEAGASPEYDRSLYVPSVWEMIPGLENHRGKAWLRTRFTTSGTPMTRIVFGGVSHTATAYIDGVNAGLHYDAFTPWDVRVPGLGAGVHELAVEIDNSFGPHSALHIENDYYTYGGIIRPVELQETGDVIIERVQAHTVLNAGRWDLQLSVTVRSHARIPRTCRVVAHIADSAIEMDLGAVEIGAGAVVECKGELKALDMHSWNEHSPVLYTLRTTLVENKNVIDDYIERIGFRQVTVRGKELLLNGTPLRVRGVNRHEDHPQFGSALPMQALASDLAIIRDLGCNFIRTSHYPNDMRFLDMCDELGIYVWEESHSRSTPFTHPRFAEQIETSTREMVQWHCNHASVIIWGCLNECETRTPQGREVYARVLQLIRDLDSSRPVTYASMYHKDDTCYDLADIVSWNRYDGWYGGGQGQVRSRIDDMLAWLHGNGSTGGKGKPVIMSEFGAGALYGYRQASRCPWSEEYQADILDESLEVYLNHPDICGAAIWQYCDVRITHNWNYTQRPRTRNNKGVVDEYRRPKLSYEIVKKRMLEAKERWGKSEHNGFADPNGGTA
jgi:beta-glucuronidase